MTTALSTTTLKAAHGGSGAGPAAVQDTVARIIEDVRQRGDAAVREHSRRLVLGHDHRYPA